MIRYCTPSRTFYGPLTFLLHRLRCSWCRARWGVK